MRSLSPLAITIVAISFLPACGSDDGEEPAPAEDAELEAVPGGLVRVPLSESGRGPEMYMAVDVSGRRGWEVRYSLTPSKDGAPASYSRLKREKDIDEALVLILDDEAEVLVPHDVSPGVVQVCIAPEVVIRDCVAVKVEDAE